MLTSCLLTSGYKRLEFYKDKLHEETVYKRFNEILVKVSDRQTDRMTTKLMCISRRNPINRVESLKLNYGSSSRYGC